MPPYPSRVSPSPGNRPVLICWWAWLRHADVTSSLPGKLFPEILKRIEQESNPSHQLYCIVLYCISICNSTNSTNYSFVQFLFHFKHNHNRSHLRHHRTNHSFNLSRYLQLTLGFWYEIPQLSVSVVDRSNSSSLWQTIILCMIVCKSETFKPRKIESMQYRSRGRSNHITDTALHRTVLLFLF